MAKKVAMIGCGGIGEYHLSHLTTFKDLQLAGFCDLIPERAEKFAAEAEKAAQEPSKAYTCWKTMLDEVQPDMVFVAVPPNCHGEIEMALIERNIPFHVQKPVSIYPEQAKEIAKAIEEKHLITAVGFQCRYDNINEAAQKFVAEHPIVFVDGSRVGGVPGAPWWRIKGESGGQLVEQAIHQVDILRYLFGDVKTVYSVARRGFVTQEEWPGYDTDDYSSTIFQFKSGLVAHLMCGDYSTDGVSWDSKMTFGGRDCRMDYRLCSSVTAFAKDTGDGAETVQGVIAGDGTQRKSDNEAGVVTKSGVDFGCISDRTFVDAVLTGDPSKIRSPYADGLKSVLTTLAANRSMETGLPVDVDTF